MHGWRQRCALAHTLLVLLRCCMGSALLCLACPGHDGGAPQVERILDLYDPRTASVRADSEFVRVLDRMAAAAARAEALPQDALRAAHPRERCLEDVRLEQPELTLGCWASG